jgi:hypothetical protein
MPPPPLFDLILNILIGDYLPLISICFFLIFFLYLKKQKQQHPGILFINLQSEILLVIVKTIKVIISVSLIFFLLCLLEAN